MRWRAALPRYRTPIIVQRAHDGAAARVGNQAQGSNLARVLKRFSTISRSGVDVPTDPAPPSHTTEPGIYSTGWTAWWPSPPSPTRQPYKIPDPPKIARPILPTRDAPILWEAFAEVGSNVWDVRISAVYTLCEWMPKTGKEQMSGNLDISVQEAALKIRPQIIESAGIDSRDWNVLRVEASNEAWQLLAITPSFRRGEFVELMCQRTRS